MAAFPHPAGMVLWGGLNKDGGAVGGFQVLDVVGLLA